MGIEEKVQADMKAAMLAKDSGKIEAIHEVKSVLLILKTSPEGLTEDAEMKAVQKEEKKRKESAKIYTNQGRSDLAEVEVFKAGVIEAYLPKQMEEAELRVALTQLITDLGATSAADMGKVMGTAKKTFAGKADGKMISAIVKDLLGKG